MRTVIPRSTHRLAQDGLANVLRHVGVLAGEAVTRASLGLPPAVILDGRDPANYIAAPEGGPVRVVRGPGRDRGRRSADRGDPLHGAAGSPARRSSKRPRDGVVAALRAITATEQGDNVIVLGQPIAADALA